MIDWDILTKDKADIPDKQRVEMETFLDNLDDALDRAPTPFLVALLTKTTNEMSERGLSVSINTFIPEREPSDRSVN